MTYLRYTSSIETPEPDEQETIDGIIQGMTQQSEVVEKREHRAVRASHAKSSAVVTGTLTIPDDLPPELAQGLFATPGSYDVAIRFAQGPGETLGDRVSTHRGMAIKVFGVRGEKLPGHDVDTQDFVFATGPTFPSGTASGFLSDAKKIGAATPMPEGVKSAVSSMARNFNRLLHAFNTSYAKADFFGHPFSHPIGDAYFSQAPIRFGEYVAKLGACPAFARPGCACAIGGSIRSRTRTASATRPSPSSATTRRGVRAEGPACGPMPRPSRSRTPRSTGRSTSSPYRTVATIRIPAPGCLQPGPRALLSTR